MRKRRPSICFHGVNGLFDKWSILTPGAPTTTSTYYDNAANDGGNYSNLKLVVQPNGSWERYSYDSSGRITNTASAFLDASTNAPDNSVRVVATTYSEIDPAVTTVETLNGQEVSRRYTVYHYGETLEIEASRPGASWDDPDNLVTITKRNVGAEFPGEIKSIQRPDGTMSLYSYELTNGLTTSVIKSGQPNLDGTDIISGTLTITVTDQAGNQTSQQTYDIASGLLLSSSTVTQQDELGRPTRTDYSDGTHD